MKSTIQQFGDKILLYSLPVAILGSVFKILHFNGANYMLIVGLSSIACGALIKYLAEQTTEGITTGCAIALACMAVLFKLMHWPYATILFQMTFVAGAVLAVILLFFNKGKKSGD